MNWKNRNGTTPLLAALARGHTEVAKLLIEAGANVNEASPKGKRVIHLASESDNLELVRLLINKGAEFNATTKMGATPLHVACAKGRLDVAKLLLKCGSDIKSNKNLVTDHHYM